MNPQLLLNSSHFLRVISILFALKIVLGYNNINSSDRKNNLKRGVIFFCGTREKRKVHGISY